MSGCKVVHLTSVHDPHDPRIFHKECRTLAAAGYAVTLIVPAERSSTIDGVQIHAVPRPANRLQRLTKTLWHLYRAALREEADLYHFHDPELLMVGLLLKLHGKRVLYDVHEDLPVQLLNKRWIPRPLRPLLARMARLAEAVGSLCLDGIVAATPPIAHRFPAAKAITVHNFPWAALGSHPERVPYGMREPLVVYVGAITRIRGAREMVAAIALLPEELGARLLLAGSIAPDLLAELQGMDGWSRTEYLGYLSQAEVQTLLGRARVGLTIMHPVPNYVEAYATKNFEYMLAGIPVVCANFPTYRWIIGETGSGLLVNPLNPGEIARAVGYLLSEPAEAAAMGLRGKRAVHEQFAWEREGERLLALYERLTHRERSVHA